MGYLVELRQVIGIVDHYDNFMNSFHKAIANVMDMNIGSGAQQKLLKAHDKYWNSKKDQPKDVLKLDASKGESRPLKKSGSNPDLATKEKAKADKTKKKKEKSVEEGDKPADETPVVFIDSSEQKPGRKRANMIIERGE